MTLPISPLRSWFWPVMTLAAISLHFWFPETSTGSAHDSYSPTALGQKAFYRLVADHPANLSVTRNRRPLTVALNTLPTEGVLCLLGPERFPTSEEWSALIDWVRNGGSLVFAFGGTKPQEIPWLNVKYIPTPATNDALEPSTHLVSSARFDMTGRCRQFSCTTVWDERSWSPRRCRFPIN
jgi:hypothetical protein